MTAIGKKALRMFNQGFDTADIAALLGISEGVICTAIDEARKELKKKKESQCQPLQDQSE